MQTRTSDMLTHYHKVSGIATAAPEETGRLPFRQVLPMWLAMAAGGWMIVALLYKVFLG